MGHARSRARAEGEVMKPEKPVKPRRACVLQLELQADTPEEIEIALRDIGLRVLMGEITTGVSGGYSSGYIYSYEKRDGPSHDEYVQQLNSWVAELKGNQKL